MFNFSTFCQSVKRHLIPILVIMVLFLAAGAGMSYLKGGSSSSTSTTSGTTYTAEAMLYVESYGYANEERQGSNYNYSLSESLAVNDVERLVTSADVAGELRSQYGEDITIATPEWIDKRTNTAIGNRYVTIDVAASDPTTAKQVANEAAQKTIEKATGMIPLQSISLASEAALRTGTVSSTSSGDWGTGAVVSGDDDTAAAATSGISAKKLVIFAGVGLVLAVVCFCAYDVLTRRVRSSSDVERLLDIPVIDVASTTGGFAGTAAAIHALMKRNGLNSVAVAGASLNDGAADVARVLGDEAVVTVSFAEDANAVTKIMQADAVALVLADSASSGKQLEHSIKQLKIAGVPVLGCVFVTKK